MSKRVFIWVAHPKSDSLCEALADAYELGVLQHGGEVRRLDLARMDFDPGFEGYGHNENAFEPDLVKWREALAWAEHVLVVHPYWWGGMPARAKAVLDRALTPGFAYKYHRRGMGWDKLLSGRTADVMITSDTPPLIDRFIYRMPGRRVMQNQVLGFCGIKIKRVKQWGSVKLASEQKKRSWITKAERFGMLAVR